MQKEWRVLANKAKNIVDKLLSNRNIDYKDKKARERFFNPDYDRDSHDPFLMKGMKKAVERIKKAIKNNEKIGIFGDYDVDGICSSFILYDFFEKVGLEKYIYLPDRHKEGYGLNLNAIKYFKEQKVNLIITTDCGSSNYNEVEDANKKGFDVIITDHHEVPQKTPRAFAILNPKQKDCHYPMRDLSGAGVAFKLAQALRKKIKHKNITEAWEKRLLDLVGFATTTDQMPLLDENRMLVYFGLKVIRKTHRLGLYYLIKVSRVKKDSIDTYDLLFALGPRINTAGRIEHASIAFNLFTARTNKEAEDIAKILDETNRRRQSIVESNMRSIKKRLENKKLGSVVFEVDKEWKPGMLGLLASKVQEDYGLPTFICYEDKDKVKCSTRTGHNFDSVAAIKKAEKYMTSWGGHKPAAGFTTKKEFLSLIEKIFIKESKKLKPEDLKPVINIDAEIEPEDINMELWNILQKIGPYGQKNTEPIFVMRNVEIKSARKVGSKEKHFKLEFCKNNIVLGGIFFNGVKNNNLAYGHKVDIAFKICLNEWNNMRKLEFNIIDFKECKM
ncbi:MAG: single-stranded-DNA-specific exonuclease RecJ [Patescibacteria group bacterium]